MKEIEDLLEAATPGPWHWVNNQTDVPEDPTRLSDVSVSLRTVEHFPTRSVGPLPKFILYAEEIDGVEVDGEWRTYDAALLVAAVNALPGLLEVVKAARALEPECAYVKFDRAACRRCGWCRLVDALASLEKGAT